MPWWAWVVGALLIILVLAFIGYRMGPQGGRAITQRDQRILERRTMESQAYVQSTGNLADVAEMAAGPVNLARQDNAAGVPPTQALALAFEKMEHLRPWLMQMTGYLMEMGVVNPMDPEQFEARIPGFSPETLKRDPGVLVKVAGVRDLYAWPTDPSAVGLDVPSVAASTAPVGVGSTGQSPIREVGGDSKPTPTQAETLVGHADFYLTVIDTFEGDFDNEGGQHYLLGPQLLGIQENLKLLYVYTQAIPIADARAKSAEWTEVHVDESDSRATILAYIDEISAQTSLFFDGKLPDELETHIRSARATVQSAQTRHSS